MSAILSADDLNDFISPGVACIKPVETLPKQRPEPINPWEVTTEDKVAATNEPPPAQISLTDCLACSGCVTSAEAVLVSLQSHQEVLGTLDAHPSLAIPDLSNLGNNAKLFVASVSPQTRASLAAIYNTTEEETGNMIAQLLNGNEGLRSGGKHSSAFEWVVDTNALRSLCHAAVIEEVMKALSSEASDTPQNPVLASACPGWICYAEKTHPHVLPHLSRIKSPQALSGTFLKSVLSRTLGISPDNIWHLAIMPCFDKKLEASREELTDTFWTANQVSMRGVRDVDCVITARELVMLADSRGISFPALPRTAPAFSSFPDLRLGDFLFSDTRRPAWLDVTEAGSSGGYAYRVLQARQAQVPGSEITLQRGRNIDIMEYTLVHDGKILMKTARYFGFRNIQNLVRKLKPEKKSKIPGARLGGAENLRNRQAVSAAARGAGMGEYAYIEVMACPGGCTNGGGQIKVEDIAAVRGLDKILRNRPAEQKQLLAQVDEAYFSADSSSEEEQDFQSPGKEDEIYQSIVGYWSYLTDVKPDKLLFTMYRQVESDVGKTKGASDMDRVVGLASSLGGGW